MDCYQLLHRVANLRGPHHRLMTRVDLTISGQHYLSWNAFVVERQGIFLNSIKFLPCFCASLALSITNEFGPNSCSEEALCSLLDFPSGSGCLTWACVSLPHWSEVCLILDLSKLSSSFIDSYSQYLVSQRSNGSESDDNLLIICYSLIDYFSTKNPLKCRRHLNSITTNLDHYLL